MSKRTASIFISSVVVFAVTTATRAELRMPRVFTDHMVLQHELPIRVWGWSDAGSKVKTEINGESAIAIADTNGRWQVVLPAMKSDGRAHTLVVTAGGDEIKLKDVLLGEVWICGGQSNMGRPVTGEQSRSADFPKIRLFNISGNTPRNEGIDDTFGWATCTPETTVRAGDGSREKGRRGFTEVGYVFGRNIHEQLDVPVGLIQMNCGGSTAKDWTPTAGVADSLTYDEPIKGLTHKPGVLYEVRMRGIVPFTARGVIWYQGEDDGRNQNYDKDLKALIESWRALFDRPNLPFYMAQIAQTGYASGMLRVWESQVWVANNVSHTGLAPSNDLQDKGIRDDKGNPKQKLPATGWPISGGSNPHPPNKHLIGTRLADIALAKTYGKLDREVFGPMYDSHEIKDGKVFIKFKHIGKGLKTDNAKPVNWFQVAPPLSKDEYHPSDQHYTGRLRKHFVKATAEIVGKDTIVVHIPAEVSEPFWISFAWHPLARHNLYNSEGLAAFPFRIWPGVPPAPK